MTTRIRFAPGALATLCAIAALALIPASAPAAVTAKLRVLTADRVLDPGTTYIVADDVTVPTRPDADCFGSPGGSGAEFAYETPNALTLLATAGRTTKSGRPALAHRPVRLRSRHLRDRRREGRLRRELLVLQGQPPGGLGRRRPARAPRRRRGPLLPRSGRLPEPEPGRARAAGAGARAGGPAVHGHGGRAQVRDPVRAAVRDRRASAGRRAG